jgi:LEA14-like dessication related protein
MRIARRAIFCLATAFAARFASAQDIQVTVGPLSITAVFSGAMEGAPSGAFSGFLSLNGSPSEIPVGGTARSTAGRVRVTMKVKYGDVPEDWLKRSRLSQFDYRLRGRIAGARNVDWSGTKPYRQIESETRDNGASDFVKLSAIALKRLTATDIAAYGKISIQNPLSFPLRLAGTDYRVSVKGREIGSGSTKSMALAPGPNALDLPIDLDQREILAAAGSALASGGSVQARFQGTLAVRLPGGDITVPLDLSGRLTLFR